jgi:hypothetical protein
LLVAKYPADPSIAKAINEIFILHCSAFGYIPYINLLIQTLIYVQQAPDPVQTSFESPAKLASTKNQLNIGGIDFKIIKIINSDKIALKLLVFICLFNKSKCLIPLNSILIK